MKGIIIVDKGLEEVALQEVYERIKSKGRKSSTIITFPVTKESELCKLAYSCQSIKRVLLLLKEMNIDHDFSKASKVLNDELSKIKFDKYRKKRISVECERVGNHDFTSVDISQEVSKILYKQELEINRKDNEVKFFVYVYKTKAYFCLDYTGRDLSKRDYRIFTKSSTLKGTLAYVLVRMAKYNPGEIILDPYCESGVIIIEATLYGMNKSTNFYKKEFAFQKLDKSYNELLKKEDKKIKKVKGIYAYDKLLSNIHNSKKNAKIAGVEKNIEFSKTDIEWLDTKFEKETVDKIVVKLPSESKRISKQSIQKLYKEFFYQSEFILKPKGLMVICCMKNDLLKEMAREKNFKVEEEKSIWSGEQEYKVTVFKKFYKQ